MKLNIEKLVYGGSGLARHDGKAIFVPFTLPGEQVEATIRKDHGGYADAELQVILKAAPERRRPPCPYFGICGGCDYQHAGYARQVEAKVSILRESLERARIEEIPEITHLTGPAFGYRNRIRLHVDRASSRVGYQRRRSHRVMPVDLCPIAAPVLERALAAIGDAARMWRLADDFSEAELFAAAEDALLLKLTTADAGRAVQRLQALWPELKRVVPEIAGAALVSAKDTRVLVRCGETSLIYSVLGRKYRVSVGSFFQVNRFLVGPLVEAVTATVSGGLAWDLYAGVGLFSTALASRFERVTAVESAPSSVADLRRNLGGAPHRVVDSTTLTFLESVRVGDANSSGADTPSLVVLDPPRAGLGREVTALLADIGPPQITYVSCDPATFARDAKSLLDSGYHLGSVRMVDLFPQTFHIESVATLLRE